jgi:hypothetical protein
MAEKRTRQVPFDAHRSRLNAVGDAEPFDPGQAWSLRHVGVRLLPSTSLLHAKAPLPNPVADSLGHSHHVRAWR